VRAIGNPRGWYGGSPHMYLPWALRTRSRCSLPESTDKAA
jgi:hypothetical protein